MSDDAQSEKGLMCQDTLACIKLLCPAPVTLSAFLITGQEEAAGVCVCVSEGVRRRGALSCRAGHAAVCG